MGEGHCEDVIIGANVKRFREMKGISRKELADLFRISEDAVYRIERGETGLSSTYAFMMANELHCDMNYLYGVAKEPVRQEFDNDKTGDLSLEKLAKELHTYTELLLQHVVTGDI